MSDKAKTGRPSKILDEKRIQKFLNLLESGMPPEDSALSVGLGVSTYYMYMQRGRAGEPLYAEFLDAVDRAQASGRVRLGLVIRKDAEVNPESAKWMLERRGRKQWSLRVNVIVQEELDRALGIIADVVDATTYGRILEALDARLGEGPTGGPPPR